MWLFVSGLLAALSLVVVVLAASALLLVASLVVIGARQLRRPELRQGMRVATDRTASTLQAARARAPKPRAPQIRAGEHARELGSRARKAAEATPRRTEDLATRAFQGYVRGMYRLRLLRLHSIDPGHRVQELNARGAKLRRDGEPEQAAEQHRAALEIVRDLGDPHAEAMTLNNLGLALAHGGAEDAALQHLEEARDVLRDLGDDAYEARVIANLGLVHRRQGHREEAVHLFQEALDKLPPGSPAYRHLEEELGRAS